MKKYKILGFIALIICIFNITGCNMTDDKEDNKDNNILETNKDEKEAYKIVFNDFVGFVKLRVNNGVITYIRLDEAFMPDVWAKETKKDSLTDVVMKDEENKLLEGEFGFAKYIKIGDKLFTGVAYTDEEIEKNPSKKQKVKYSSGKIGDLYTYLTKEENAKWYVECLQKGEAYVCDKDGKKLETASLNSYGSFFKSSSLYWTTGDSGWSKNMQYLCNAVIGTNVSKEITMEDGYVKIGDIVTSATLVGYKDYYSLIQEAYKKTK